MSEIDLKAGWLSRLEKGRLSVFGVEASPAGPLDPLADIFRTSTWRHVNELGGDVEVFDISGDFERKPDRAGESDVALKGWRVVGEHVSPVF